MISAALVSLLVAMAVQAGESNLEENFVRMQTSNSTEFHRSFVENDERKWRNNHVEYYIEKSYSPEEKTAIRSAITYITDQLVEGCLRFEELDEQPSKGESYMLFEDKGPCAESHVGRRSKTFTSVRIRTRANCMERGRVVHEILHALGAGHEHNREDRDVFINLNMNNVLPRDRHNFEKNVNFITHETPYDVFSIMHYGRYAGAKDEKIPVITFKIHLEQEQDASNKANMTPTDIVELSRQYQCNITEEIKIQHLSYTAHVFEMMVINIDASLESKDNLIECGDKLEIAKTILEELEFLNSTMFEVYRSQYFTLKVRYTSLKETLELKNEVLTLKSQNQVLQEEIRMIQTQNQEFQSYMKTITDLLEDKLQNDKDELQGEIDSVQGDITNVKGDIVDMQNANSALCAFQDTVGGGNNGLSGNIVVYDTTYLETNGASCSLDKSTGKFTAGKSGVYQISVSAQAGKTVDSSYFRLYLRTSSGNYQDGYEAYIAFQQAVGTSDLKTPLNAIRFITLQQGETAWLEYTTTSTSCAIYKLKFCVSLYK